MNIQLSDHFSYRKLMRFTFPSILMLIFTSIYGVVDGFFVSNFVGKTPFAALNFIMPFLMILGAVGFMFGTGGGALIAKMMGEEKQKEANQTFSLFIYVTAVLGAVLAVLGMLLIGPITYLVISLSSAWKCFRYSGMPSNTSFDLRRFGSRKVEKYASPFLPKPLMQP